MKIQLYEVGNDRRFPTSKIGGELGTGMMPLSGTTVRFLDTGSRIHRYYAEVEFDQRGIDQMLTILAIFEKRLTRRK